MYIINNQSIEFAKGLMMRAKVGLSLDPSRAQDDSKCCADYANKQALYREI